MPQLLIPTKELYEDRPTRVQSLLARLSNKQPVPAQVVPGQFEGATVIAAGTSFGTNVHYDSYRFIAKGGKLWVKYFELWRPATPKQLFLYRAYLTILRMNTEHKLEQLFCIHTDPDEKGENPLALYKRGPHLHVCCGESPLADCHIPLSLGSLQRALSGIPRLTGAMSHAIAMVANEVLTKDWGAVAVTTQPSDLK